jgi:hypothetical protein
MEGVVGGGRFSTEKNGDETTITGQRKGGIN